MSLNSMSFNNNNSSSGHNAESQNKKVSLDDDGLSNWPTRDFALVDVLE